MLLSKSDATSTSADEDLQEDSPTGVTSKHDLVEPVVYRNGPITSAQRNDIYKTHNLPGIGKRAVLTPEEEAKKKVVVIFASIDSSNSFE